MNDEVRGYLSDVDRAGAERFFADVPPEATASLAELRGEQDAPVHHPGVVGTHDLVIEELNAVVRLPSGRPLTPWMRLATQQVIASRRDAGLASYGTVLQPGNGRNCGRDALEEAADLVNYLRNGMREGYPWQRMYDLATELLVDLTAQTGGLS